VGAAWTAEAAKINARTVTAQLTHLGWWAPFLGVLSLGVVLSPPAQARSAVAFSFPVHEKTLENGLHVVVVNYDSPGILAPFLASRTSADIQVTVRPTRSLKIDNTYLFFGLHHCANCDTPLGSLNNHIIRTRVNYQFNKELSFRFIGQYSAVLANSNFTSLQTTKNFNADFLITYLVHPSTALYVGYNSNLENVLNPPQLDANGDLARGGRLLNDGRNFFVKASYLFRF